MQFRYLNMVNDRIPAEVENLSTEKLRERYHLIWFEQAFLLYHEFVEENLDNTAKYFLEEELFQYYKTLSADEKYDILSLANLMNVVFIPSEKETA